MAVTKVPWRFYGRASELAAIRDVVSRERWFLLRVSGRRRIGKTALVLEAIRREREGRIAYVQVEDGDPAGVVEVARRHLRLSGVREELLPSDLIGLAACVGNLAAAGWIVVLDEFQYFHRKALYPFNAHLQFEVDRFRVQRRPGTGGLVLMGSIQTEMEALLGDRRAPLFGRSNAVLNLDHLDIAAVLEILDDHGDQSPERLLFAWTLFQGIPKYWQDAYEEGVLGGSRRALLGALFFASSAPLREEGNLWLLEELRGRYDLFLRYIADHPGCTRGDILAHARSLQSYEETQAGYYLAALQERFHLIERREPVFSAAKARSGRYHVSDNFLHAWLAALADPVALLGVRPLDDLVAEADRRLQVVEGGTLERLVATLYAERSRRGVGDFALSSVIRGWWDRAGTELDLVAINESERRIRLGSCKRDPAKLLADLPRFDGHIARFLTAFPRLSDWSVEKMAIAPRLDAAQRKVAEAAGYVPEDLSDLTSGLRA